MFAKAALDKLLADYRFQTVLDVGSGPGEHAAAFRAAGKDVTETDYARDGDYLLQRFDRHFDVVWCSHVLEHAPNPNAFLRTIAQDCVSGGLIAITVPPMKPQIVGGHLTVWNAGLLVYNMVVAGIDCCDCHIKTYDYNISVIAKNVPALLPPLANDCGDIRRLAAFFPPCLQEGRSGEIPQWNW